MKTLFTSTITTSRVTDKAGTDNQEWIANLTNIKCNIQPLDGSSNQDLDGSYGKDYLMFCDVIDIIEGDKITSGATEYLVKGVKSYDVSLYSVMEIQLRLTQ